MNEKFMDEWMNICMNNLMDVWVGKQVNGYTLDEYMD